MSFTFGIIKAPSVKRGHLCQIRSMIVSFGFDIIEAKPVVMSESQLTALYQEHLNNPYFGLVKESLVGQLSVAILILHRSFRDVPQAFRTVIGNHSDSLRCAPGTIRSIWGGQHFGTSVLFYGDNAVHGSDTLTDARREAAIFNMSYLSTVDKGGN